MDNSRDIVQKIDGIASRLESKGLLKEAFDLDVIANSLEVEAAIGPKVQQAIGKLKNLAPDILQKAVKEYFSMKAQGKQPPAPPQGMSVEAAKGTFLMPAIIGLIGLVAQATNAQTPEQLNKILGQQPAQTQEQTVDYRVNQEDTKRMTDLIPYEEVVTKMDIGLLKMGIAPFRVFSAALENKLDRGFHRYMLPQIKKDPKFSYLLQNNPKELCNLIATAFMHKMDQEPYSEARAVLGKYLHRKGKTMNDVRGVVAEGIQKELTKLSGKGA